MPMKIPGGAVVLMLVLVLFHRSLPVFAVLLRSEPGAVIWTFHCAVIKCSAYVAPAPCRDAMSEEPTRLPFSAVIGIRG